MTTDQQAAARREARRAASQISLQVQELWACCQDDNTIGDNGVAELLVEIETRITLLKPKLP